MTTEQQRIAIAEACGWTDISEPYSNEFVWTGIFRSLFREPIPDYLNDLNAMHEAEKVLTESQFQVYLDWIDTVCGGKLELRAMLEGSALVFALVHATAAQRAEALLRTLNLWTE